MNQPLENHCLSEMGPRSEAVAEQLTGGGLEADKPGQQFDNNNCIFLQPELGPLTDVPALVNQIWLAGVAMPVSATWSA